MRSLRLKVLLCSLVGVWVFLGNGLNSAPPGFWRETLLTGLDHPSAIAFTPDGRMLVAQRSGAIVLLHPEGGGQERRRFHQIANVSTSEGGLLDIVPDPYFSLNRHYYVFYTAREPRRARVSRFTVSGEVTVPQSEVVVWQSRDVAVPGHSGGGIGFGRDGRLYIATGDGDVPPAAQDLTTDLGKLLRINADGTVPSDNPFVDGDGPQRDEIWAVGLRNPTRLSFDRLHGQMYIADARGAAPARGVEEVNVGSRGANYGWPVCDGPCGAAGLTNPLYWYAAVGQGTGLTGGFVYRGSRFPGRYVGSYFFADPSQGWLRVLNLAGPGGVTGIEDFDPGAGGLDGPYGNIVELKEGPDGAVYYLDAGARSADGTVWPGRVVRIRYGRGRATPDAVHTEAHPRNSGFHVTEALDASGFTSGQLVAYSFDQGNGPTLRDDSGSGYDAVISGATWSVSGQHHGALSFDGVNDRATAATITLPGTFTLMAWVFNPSNVPYETILTVGTPRLMYLSNGSVTFYDGAVDRSFGPAISTNAWHHVAIVSTGTQILAYVNGAQRGPAQNAVLTSASGVLQIGAWILGAANYDWFGGRIDDVRVFTRALSLLEVQTGMTTPVPNSSDQTPPTAAITAPTGGSVVSGTIAIHASASDNTGVAGVQFLLDGQPIGAEDLTAPYSVAWDTTLSSAGGHMVAARARDLAGNVGTSTSVSVIVNNAAPTMTITSPAPDATIAGTTVRVLYALSGDLTVVDHVHFHLNANPPVMDLDADGSIDLTGVPVGQHSLRGVAVRQDHSEIAGSETTLTFATIPAPADSEPPSITLLSPASGATVSGMVTMAAAAADNTGIAGVYFLVDGALQGQGTPPSPYTFFWNSAGVPDGPRTITALARDLAGNEAATAVAVVVSNGTTTTPTVAVTAPVAGARVSGLVTVTASASAGSGIAGVQFLVDGAPHGAEDLVAPFSIPWATIGLPNRPFRLAARMRDGSSNVTTSAAIVVIVDNRPPGGFALRFFGNGVSDIDRIKIRIDDPANTSPGPPADVGATDFTLEFWLKGTAAENPSAPVACGGGNVNWIFGNVIVDRDRFNQSRKFGVSIAGGRVVFGVSGAGTGDWTICGTTGVLDNQWHHIAVQRRRADGWLWLYVDGVLEAQANGPDGDISYPDDGVPGNFCGGSCVNSDPFLVIGAEKHDVGPAYPSFSGWFDELRVSTVLRYPGSFTRPTQPFVPDAGVAALYTFDEGAGDVVVDWSVQVGGPSAGVRRYGGSPGGPQWVTDTPFLGPPTDTTPPILSAGTPSGTLPAGTTAATLALVSNEPATCRYGPAAGTPYVALPTAFTMTGGTTHATSLTGLSGGSSYASYVRCQDVAGNATTSDFVIAFAVALPGDTTPPVLSGGTPSGMLPAGTTTAALGLVSNEPATCRYGPVAGTAYGALPTVFTTTGGTMHATAVTGLSGGSYTYHVRCQDVAGNATTSDFVITFAVAGPGDLLVAYGLNAGTGTAAVDASGNNSHGTIVGATWTTEGRYGSALSFDGNGDRVSGPTITLGSAFTYSAWIYNPSDQVYETILTVGLQRDFYIQSGRLRFDSGVERVFNGPLLANNAWHHVVVVYSGSALQAYLNGAAYGTTIPVTLGTVVAPLTVGAWNTTQDVFSGRIDEVRVFNRALSQAEVQNLATVSIP